MGQKQDKVGDLGGGGGSTIFVFLIQVIVTGVWGHFF